MGDASVENRFIKIPPKVLLSVATESDRMPKLYYHPVAVARSFFWRRLSFLYELMEKYTAERLTCLDFGCGSGVFLPSLANLFATVTGIDMEVDEATEIVKLYHLSNVQIVKGDITAHDLGKASFDAISAADVLEHFQELDAPVSRIYDWLKPGGFLFTSLPTENFFTRFTRIIGKYKKPWDHYHTAEEVEHFLRGKGFFKVEEGKVTPWYPLYSIGVWKKKKAAEDYQASLAPRPFGK